MTKCYYRSNCDERGSDVSMWYESLKKGLVRTWVSKPTMGRKM